MASSSNNNNNSEMLDSVDFDTKPPAIVNDLAMSSSPASRSNDIRLTMVDPNIPESMPGDEEIAPGPEESWKPDPQGQSPSSPTPGRNNTLLSTDEDEEANKDGIVKPSKKTKKKKKPEMNPRYKDVHETGQWGELSSKEFYVAIAAFVLVIIAVVLVVVFVVILPNNNDSPPAGVSGNGTEVIVPAPTKAPTMPPTIIPANEELALVLAAMQASPFTTPLLEGSQLPNNPSFYEGFMDADAGTPQQKAMDWLLFQDELKDPEQSVMRFAFASFYYQTDGPNWVSSEGWLSSVPLCDWDHISCDSRGVLQEVDFDGQNLSGTIPLDLALLSDSGIQSFLMTRNNLSGSIPGGVFASLPRLVILYLDNNALTGSVPPELVVDGNIHTLYVQGNQLTGEWPTEFCQGSLVGFGLDCDKLTCNPDCCTPIECY